MERAEKLISKKGEGLEKKEEIGNLDVRHKKRRAGSSPSVYKLIEEFPRSILKRTVSQRGQSKIYRVYGGTGRKKKVLTLRQAGETRVKKRARKGGGQGKDNVARLRRSTRYPKDKKFTGSARQRIKEDGLPL